MSDGKDNVNGLGNVTFAELEKCFYEMRDHRNELKDEIEKEKLLFNALSEITKELKIEVEREKESFNKTFASNLELITSCKEYEKIVQEREEQSSRIFEEKEEMRRSWGKAESFNSKLNSEVGRLQEANNHFAKSNDRLLRIIENLSTKGS